MFSNLYDISKPKRFVPDFNSHISLRDGLKAYLSTMEEPPKLKALEPGFESFCDSVIAQKSYKNYNE